VHQAAYCCWTRLLDVVWINLVEGLEPLSSRNIGRLKLQLSPTAHVRWLPSRLHLHPLDPEIAIELLHFLAVSQFSGARDLVSDSLRLESCDSGLPIIGLNIIFSLLTTQFVNLDAQPWHRPQP